MDAEDEERGALTWVPGEIALYTGAELDFNAQWFVFGCLVYLACAGAGSFEVGSGVSRENLVSASSRRFC